MVRDSFARLERIDHLVTAAAGSLRGRIVDLDTQRARALFESKFWGATPLREIRRATRRSRRIDHLVLRLGQSKAHAGNVDAGRGRRRYRSIGAESGTRVGTDTRQRNHTRTDRYSPLARVYPKPRPRHISIELRNPIQSAARELPKTSHRPFYF